MSSSNLVKTQDQIHPNEHWGNGEINTGEINMQGVPIQIHFSQYYTLPLSFRAKGQEAGSVVRISIDQNSKQCGELLTLA